MADSFDSCCCLCICIFACANSICTYLPSSWCCPCAGKKSSKDDDDDDRFIDSVEQQNFYGNQQHPNQSREYGRREAHELPFDIGPRGHLPTANGNANGHAQPSNGDAYHNRQPSSPPPAYPHEHARSRSASGGGNPMTYPPRQEMRIPQVPVRGGHPVVEENNGEHLQNPYGGLGEEERTDARQQQQQQQQHQHSRSQSRPDQVPNGDHVREKSVN